MKPTADFVSDRRAMTTSSPRRNIDGGGKLQAILAVPAASADKTGIASLNLAHFR